MCGRSQLELKLYADLLTPAGLISYRVKCPISVGVAMLSQIVRPMVRTQIRLLASTHATRSTLVSTIAQWLSFLGVQAEVTELGTQSKQIRVSLTVGKPEACDEYDWHKILHKLEDSQTEVATNQETMVSLTPKQEIKLQRLLAYVIQVGDSNQALNWDALEPQLQSLGLSASMLLGIKSALKVPQSLDQLMEGLDTDVAALALPRAVGIALFDRQVNPLEDKALSVLLEAMRQQAEVS